MCQGDIERCLCEVTKGTSWHGTACEMIMSAAWQHLADGAAAFCSEEAADVAEVQRLQQAAAAALWAAQAAAGSGGRRWGSFASDAEWRSVVNRRRDAASTQGLFLTELQHALRGAVGPVSMRPNPLS